MLRIEIGPLTFTSVHIPLQIALDHDRTTRPRVSQFLFQSVASRQSPPEHQTAAKRPQRPPLVSADSTTQAIARSNRGDPCLCAFLGIRCSIQTCPCLFRHRMLGVAQAQVYLRNRTGYSQDPQGISLRLPRWNLNNKGTNAARSSRTTRMACSSFRT